MRILLIGRNADFPKATFEFVLQGVLCQHGETVRTERFNRGRFTGTDPASLKNVKWLIQDIAGGPAKKVEGPPIHGL